MFNKKLFLTKRRRRSNRFLDLIRLIESLNPVVAYSISRRLSSSADKLIRVRRASDNVELDIGSVSGILDTQTLINFGGASDCFVTTWYDQIGSNHATQTVATNQPKIYDVLTGDVTRENGKPAMVFDGVDDKLELIDNGIITRQPNSIAAVAARKGGTNSVDYLFDGANGRQILMISPNDYRLFSGHSIISSNSSDTNQHLFLGELGLTDTLFIDSIEVASGNAGSNKLAGMTIGGSSNNNNNVLNGVIQEMIIFDNNLTPDNRQKLHDDINDHYGIF